MHVKTTSPKGTHARQFVWDRAKRIISGREQPHQTMVGEVGMAE